MPAEGPSSRPAAHLVARPDTAPPPASPDPAPEAGETEVALDLPDLGPVRLRIRDRQGRLALHVLADHPATLDLMRRHADELAGALVEVGLPGATLSWGEGSAGQDRPAARPDDQSAAAGAPAPDAPVLLRPARPYADLDLLL